MVGESKVNNNGWAIRVGLSYIEANNSGLCGLPSDIASGLLRLTASIECFDAKATAYLRCVAQ